MNCLCVDSVNSRIPMSSGQGTAARKNGKLAAATAGAQGSPRRKKSVSTVGIAKSPVSAKTVATRV